MSHVSNVSVRFSNRAETAVFSPGPKPLSSMQRVRMWHTRQLYLYDLLILFIVGQRIRYTHIASAVVVFSATHALRSTRHRARHLTEETTMAQSAIVVYACLLLLL
jgi:hypothetical protein